MTGKGGKITTGSMYRVCGRKSSYGYPLFLGLMCAKTFFHTLYVMDDSKQFHVGEKFAVI